MEEQTSADRIIPSRVASAGKGIAGKLLYYLRSGLFFYWASFFILIFIEFLLGGQLSKILTKENYSLYANVLNTLPFYNVIVNLGLSYGIVYIVAYQPDIRFSLFRQSVKLQTAWYFILIATHLVIFFIFRNTYVTSLLLTVLISYTYSYRLNANSFFTATRAYNKAALANSMQKVSLLVIFIIIHHVAAFISRLNNNFIVLYPAIEIGVILLYLVVFLRTNYDTFTAKKINYSRRLLKYSRYSMFNNGLNLLNYSVLAFIIRSSQIDISLQIIFLLCIVFFRYAGVAIAPVLSVMNPLFTRIKNNRPGIRDMYRKYYLFVIGIGIFVVIGCRCFFGYVIDTFYASAYHKLPRYFNVFTWLLPLSFINSLNANVMSALGRIKFTFRTELVCSALLTSFLIYNVILPAHSYHFIYRIMFIYLVIKFLLQSYGAYIAVYKR